MKDNPLRVFRGDYRADRVGDKFKVNRTTSGRFYFTDDPEIASKYSEGIRQAGPGNDQSRLVLIDSPAPHQHVRWRWHQAPEIYFRSCSPVMTQRACSCFSHSRELVWSECVLPPAYSTTQCFVSNATASSGELCSMETLSIW